MKRNRIAILCVVLAAALTLSVTLFAAKTGSSARFTLRAGDTVIDAPALVMVPARKVAEALGWKVTWLGNGQFTLDAGGEKTTVTLGEDAYPLGGTSVSYGIPPYCVGGVSYVPLALMEALAGDAFQSDGEEITLRVHETEEPVLGGWQLAEDKKLTDEVKTALKTAQAKLRDVSYAPIALLASQVVAGENLCVLCFEQTGAEQPHFRYALVYVYKDLQGGAEITNVAELPVSWVASANEGPMPGGWSFSGSAGADAEMTEALQEKGLTPVAHLGSQVVAGNNHCVLCRTESGYEMETVYEALDGHYEIYADGRIDVAALSESGK